MTQNELLNALIDISNSREFKVPDDILREILAIVIKNPLPEDRGKCQEQIKLVLSQRWSVENDN